jgi:hypothetical protein
VILDLESFIFHLFQVEACDDDSLTVSLQPRRLMLSASAFNQTNNQQPMETKPMCKTVVCHHPLLVDPINVIASDWSRLSGGFFLDLRPRWCHGIKQVIFKHEREREREGGGKSIQFLIYSTVTICHNRLTVEIAKRP